jgi:hypothetical protein
MFRKTIPTLAALSLGGGALLARELKDKAGTRAACAPRFLDPKNKRNSVDLAKRSG